MSNILRNLRTVVSTEFLKLRYTVAFWLTILYPLGTVVLASLFHYADRNRITTDSVSFINNFNSLASFFLPFYAVLMVSFLCHLEHRNSMIKHLYSLPVPRGIQFLGKFAASFLLMTITWFLLLGLLYLSHILLGFSTPKLRISSSFDHAYLFMVVTRTFLSAVAMLVIQFLLSMKLKNVVASVSIGTSFVILPVAILFVMGVTGLISNPRVLQWLPKYDPYAFPFAHVFNFSESGPVKQAFYSNELVIWFFIAIILVILGYFEIRRRDIK